MRLTPTEIEMIKKTFYEVFGDGKIYLFGSRVDDSLKGGDIDLFIDTITTNKLQKKIEFLSALKQRIGDQKIDVVISKDYTRLIEREALAKGIEL
ncbi:hypothetical protein MNB_SM-5-505 [hydrothermal vent metagenome]|uniref:Polymerase beta nucleotidyltransferase domain-containing protein n=1 Tax=hydrothermal vent metagenome TaxID=652676 RepID=A0A1W1CYG3_9ZZZZ